MKPEANPDPDEQHILLDFLGMCSEGYVPYPQEDYMTPPNKSIIDPATASRDAMLEYCLDALKGCPSYHRSFTRKTLAMLSDCYLRHIVKLLQELVDPDLAEQRWTTASQELVQGKLNNPPQETEFQLTSEPHVPDTGNDDTSIVISRDLIVDNDTPDDEILLPDDEENEDDIRRGTNVAGIALIPTGTETPDPLFQPPPEEKETWNGA